MSVNKKMMDFHRTEETKLSSVQMFLLKLQSAAFPTERTIIPNSATKEPQYLLDPAESFLTVNTVGI